MIAIIVEASEADPVCRMSPGDAVLPRDQRGPDKQADDHREQHQREGGGQFLGQDEGDAGRHDDQDEQCHQPASFPVRAPAAVASAKVSSSGDGPARRLAAHIRGRTVRAFR
jgi:hypothetical protein